MPFAENHPYLFVTALGVADSPFNREFLTRYKQYQRVQSAFFADNSCPVRLAEEVACSGVK